MSKRKKGAPPGHPGGGGGMLPREQDEGPDEFATDAGACYAEKHLGSLPDEPPELSERKGWQE